MFSTKSDVFFSGVLCLLAALSIIVSYNILPLILPDSESYIVFSSNRGSFYPALIDFLNLFSDNLWFVVLIQVVFYLITFYMLVKNVHQHYRSYVVTLIFICFGKVTKKMPMWKAFTINEGGWGNCWK